MGILESHLVSNFTDRLIRIGKALFDLIDYRQLDILLSRFPGFLFYLVAKIISRQVQFVRTIGDGRQPIDFGGFRIKITDQ